MTNKITDKNFDEWLDTFIEEKEIDLNESFEINKNGTLNVFEYGVVIEAMKSTSLEEKSKLKNKMVMLDFFNKDIKSFLRHLATALAEDYDF